MGRRAYGQGKGSRRKYEAGGVFLQQEFLDQVLQELLRSVFAVSWDVKMLFSTHRPIFCHFSNPAHAAKDGPYALVAALCISFSLLVASAARATVYSQTRHPNCACMWLVTSAVTRQVEDNGILPRLLQTHLDAYNMTTPQVMIPASPLTPRPILGYSGPAMGRARRR